MKSNNEKAEKLKRFDDVFRMLLVVMTITTSIGLSTYSGFDLWGTLVYFVASLVFWSLGHLMGPSPSLAELEIVIKISGWVLALLVTTSTIVKFAFKIAVLNLAAKSFVVAVTLILTISTYCWFGELIPPYIRSRYMFLNLALLMLFFGGYFYF